MNELRKLQALIAAVHVAAFAGLVFLWSPSWLVLTIVAYIAFLWLGHDLYQHRYLSHRSFEMPVWFQRVCAVLGVYCLFGTPIGIASTHVRHHRYADTNKDPHPAHHPLYSWFWLSPEMQARDRATVVRLSKDSWLKFIGKNYFAIYLSTVAIALLINPKIAIYGFFLPAVYGFFSNGLVNVICHRWGYRRYETADKSRNNLIVNAVLLFGGIALHNTHHAHPQYYQLSRAWYELDLVGSLAGFIHHALRRV